jgi:hypothetical protein
VEIAFMLNDNKQTQKSNSKISYFDAPLSKAHIRPFSNSNIAEIEYFEGASLFRTNKKRKCPAVGGGKRSSIKGFSNSSRRRLLETIATVKKDAQLPLFVTLTYPSKFPTVERAKRDLKVFIQRFNRKFPSAGAIWKLEPQERGAPHYHLLVWGCKKIQLLSFVVNNWYEIAGDGDKNHYLFHLGALKGSQPCVSEVRSWRGVWAYAAKYLGKTFEVADWGKLWTGRFWGVISRENIPVGNKRILQVDYKKVITIMRYQRRFMNMRKSRDYNSLKTFCDADQWVNKLLGSGPAENGGAPDPCGEGYHFRMDQLP